MSDALLTCALEAAAAGARVQEEGSVHRRGVRPAFERKTSAIDLVTEIDRNAEREVIAVLRRTGLAIVAEEGTRIESSEGEPGVWYVDPLDGTTNFAHGHPFHCVSIGLVRGGVPVLGVIHAPALGVIWYGGASIRAMRRDLFRGTERAIGVSQVASIDDALLATGFPYDRRTSDDDNLAAHGAMLKRAQGVLRCGSAAIDLALVSDGTYDGYWERKLAPWDIAAGAALVLAAGGMATDPWGNALDVEAGWMLAANPTLHGRLREALAAYLPAAAGTRTIAESGK